MGSDYSQWQPSEDETAVVMADNTKDDWDFAAESGCAMHTDSDGDESVGVGSKSKKTADTCAVRKGDATIEEAVGGMISADESQEAERKRRQRVGENRNVQVRTVYAGCRAWVGAHRKMLGKAVLLVFLVILVLAAGLEIGKMIPFGYSEEALKGVGYTQAVQKLKEAGFSNVKTKNIADLSVEEEEQEKLVTEVEIVFGDSFDADTRYPSDFPVTVVYHTLKIYHPPFSSKDASGMNYLQLKEEFEKAGFRRVTVVPEYDIVTGLMAQDGEVKSITVGGRKKFETLDEFRSDAEVVIVYHTLKSNKPS